jgi:hypothetical protein
MAVVRPSESTLRIKHKKRRNKSAATFLRTMRQNKQQPTCDVRNHSKTRQWHSPAAFQNEHGWRTEILLRHAILSFSERQEPATNHQEMDQSFLCPISLAQIVPTWLAPRFLRHQTAAQGCQLMSEQTTGQFILRVSVLFSPMRDHLFWALCRQSSSSKDQHRTRTDLSHAWGLWNKVRLHA